MARSPKPTWAWVEQQVVGVLAALSGLSPQYIRSHPGLLSLGLDKIGELAALAHQLSAWPTLASRGLLLIPSATSTARTVEDLVRLVSRALSVPSAPSRTRRAELGAGKKRVSKPAKRPARKSVKVPARKPIKKRPKRPVPGRAASGIGYLARSPSAGRAGGGSVFDPFGAGFRVFSGKTSSTRGRTRARKKAAKRTARERPPPARERAVRRRRARPRPSMPHRWSLPALEPRYANTGLYEIANEHRLDTARSLNPWPDRTPASRYWRALIRKPSR